MGESNLETQIDYFLEQFKRNASKAMEEHIAVRRSRSSYLDAEEAHDEVATPCEEIEMVNALQSEPLSLDHVVDLLQQQYAIISGGKSKEGCPIITFPDNNNFHLLTDVDYQRLMMYLTSVPSMQEADMGFHLIIDRRRDRWNSVKTVLLKISVYFPGLIHVVYVIRPASFLQKALSEVSNKLFKGEFKFRMIVLNTVEELYDYIDLTQLTPHLGGSLQYSHTDWIHQQAELEKFSSATQQVSNALDKFTRIIDEAELPNDVDSTQQLLTSQTIEYSKLKEEILLAAKDGEALLTSIKEKLGNCDSIGNVFAVERLLVQLEETERTFDEFWQHHTTKLRHCLDLRRFEQDFRELQVNFNSHLKTVGDMTELGENVPRVNDLIKEVSAFDKLCLVDIERAEEVISSGQNLVQNKVFYPLQCVEPKCSELVRMKETLSEKLLKRKESLSRCRHILEAAENINQCCAKGLDLLAAQKVEKCPVDKAKTYKQDLEELVKTLEYERNRISLTDVQDFIGAENKSLVVQILEKTDGVLLQCEKRLAALDAVLNAPIVTPTVPVEPLGGAPQPKKKSVKIPKSESTEPSLEVDVHQNEILTVKIGHVLSELLETEKLYVAELSCIITGYKMEARSAEMQHLVTPDVVDKINLLFGNLEEIHAFHSNIFLQDLERCISSTDLVALCFVERRDAFFRLYSCYCQNITKCEQVRESLGDCTAFFQACQQKLGHKLPLAAYLLKPVQRITKYQLLLKDMLHYTEQQRNCKELQQALDCMLVVLRCVNDSMHQISITGFPVDLSQQGDLLIQGSFSIWMENKKDLRIRLKPLRRHIFLYQKSILFCKSTSKSIQNKATYQFKHYVKMSQIGLTESVKGDSRKFEIWLQGRQEVYTIQASTVEQKQTWVTEIKRVLFNQLEELKGEKIKEYSSKIHKPLRQATSWDKHECVPISLISTSQRTMSCDTESQTSQVADESSLEVEAENWSSDCSNSDDEDHTNNVPVPSCRYVALADYSSIGNNEINMKEGDIVVLLKVGCAGWWFVKVIGSSLEGWAPAAYLEPLHRRSSRSSSRSQDKLSDH